MIKSDGMILHRPSPTVWLAYAAGVLRLDFVVSWKICRKADASIAEEN